MRILSLIVLTFLACGRPDTIAPVQDTRLEELSGQMLELSGTVAQINAIVSSDFKTCPASGDTADALIRKICQVAKASTIELQIELQAQIAALAEETSKQIDTINKNLATVNDSTDSRLTAAELAITNINATLGTLGTRMTNAENAITAIQGTLGTIVAGNVESVQIGSENLSAGPFYESVLRPLTKTRVTAYVEAYGATQALPNNPVTATNGSTVLVVTLTAHGYLAGDYIEMDLLVGSRGLSDGHLQRGFVIASVTTNTFTITSPKAATSNGTLGSNLGTVRKVLGKGMGKIWATADGADAAVRQTTLGKPYNFIIKANGDICYDTANRAATFATINAGGGTTICK